MNLEFQDLEDRSNPANGTMVRAILDLRALFANARDRRPFFFTLTNADGELTIGFASEIGCIQHSNPKGDPPYMMAVSPESKDGFVEFLAGGTATPVPKRYCLTADSVIELVAEFLESGRKSASVKWEEI